MPLGFMFRDIWNCGSTNPKGWQKVAGGRAERPPVQSRIFNSTPEGVPDFTCSHYIFQIENSRRSVWSRLRQCSAQNLWHLFKVQNRVEHLIRRSPQKPGDLRLLSGNPSGCGLGTNEILVALLVLGRSRARNGKWVVISTTVETVELAAPEDERTPLLSPGLVVLTRCVPRRPLIFFLTLGRGCL
jgi:hypothetical protein